MTVKEALALTEDLSYKHFWADTVCLYGEFSLDELEALVIVMREHIRKREEAV